MLTECQEDNIMYLNYYSTYSQIFKRALFTQIYIKAFPACVIFKFVEEINLIRNKNNAI